MKTRLYCASTERKKIRDKGILFILYSWNEYTLAQAESQDAKLQYMLIFSQYLYKIHRFSTDIKFTLAKYLFFYGLLQLSSNLESSKTFCLT